MIITFDELSTLKKQKVYKPLFFDGKKGCNLIKSFQPLTIPNKNKKDKKSL